MASAAPAFSACIQRAAPHGLQAVANFQRGAALEDPDAMVSLARMIFSSSPQQAVRWLDRAARLGHREAAEYLQRLRAAPYPNPPSGYAPQPQRYDGDPGAQLMIQMLGTIVGNVRR
jgi:TPR repeat protein